MPSIPQPYAIRAGRGEPTILLHGVGGRAENWLPLIPLVTQGRDVTALDLPGFGRTPLGGVTPTVTGYADYLVDILRQWGVDRPHVVGNSLGGAVALELGRRGYARSVVAFAPIGFWGAGGQVWIVDVLRAMRKVSPWLRPLLPGLVATRAGRTALFSLFYGRAADVPRQTLVADADAFMGAEALDEALTNFSAIVFDCAGQLTDIPVTVVWGRRDLLLPARQARSARIALRHAQHVLLEGCGHVPFHDDPQGCAMLLLRQWRQACDPALASLPAVQSQQRPARRAS